MKNAHIPRWPTSGWAELMKPDEEYVSNDEWDIPTKFHEYRINFDQIMTFHALGGAIEPSKYVEPYNCTFT